MPSYWLLGIEIYIPSVDDIVNGVLAPITTLINTIQGAIVDTLTPIINTVTNTLSPLFQGVIDNVTTFLSTTFSGLGVTLDSVWGSVSNLWTDISVGLGNLWGDISREFTSIGISVSTGLGNLWGDITKGLGDLGASLEGFITSSGVTIQNAVNTAGATMSGALESAQGVLMTAFDGMGNAVSSAIGGMFAGFGSLNVDALLGAHIDVKGILDTTVKLFGMLHSPITPAEAASWTPNFISQVSAAVGTLHITNTITEGLSLGQVDVCLAEAWKYPATAAALELATEFQAMPLREGLGPALKRHILKQYQPNIPPYMDLISIYVKEGYMPDHWVELPSEMVENFKELGFPEYWTKRLWGKHWNYPSATQLFEMLHRTAGTRTEIGVTTEVLREMLKLHDYEPKWRPRLEAISWRTWRIYDTRTAWEMGIDDDETLYKRLVDQGYEPADARLLSKVQKMFVLRSEIDRLLTESDQDFIEGWISEATLKADYEATPYNPYVVELRVARARLRRSRELKRDIKAALIDRFKKDDLTETELKQELSRLGVIEEWIAAEVTRANAYKLKRAS